MAGSLFSHFHVCFLKARGPTVLGIGSHKQPTVVGPLDTSNSKQAIRTDIASKVNNARDFELQK